MNNFDAVIMYDVRVTCVSFVILSFLSVFSRVRCVQGTHDLSAASLTCALLMQYTHTHIYIYIHIWPYVSFYKHMA